MFMCTSLFLSLLFCCCRFFSVSVRFFLFSFENGTNRLCSCHSAGFKILIDNNLSHFVMTWNICFFARAPHAVCWWLFYYSKKYSQTNNCDMNIYKKWNSFRYRGSFLFFLQIHLVSQFVMSMKSLLMTFSGWGLIVASSSVVCCCTRIENVNTHNSNSG